MRIRVAAVAALVVGLIGLITLPYLATGTVTVSSPRMESLPSTPACRLDNPYFYYDDKNKESARAFGPSADLPNQDKVVEEFLYRLCGDERRGGDPVLQRVIWSVFLTDARPVPAAAFDAVNLDQLLSRFDWDRSHVVTRTLPFGTKTLFMEDDGRDLPEITVGSTTLLHRHSAYLVLYFKGVKTPTLLRLACGFQPVGTSEKVDRFMANLK